MKINDVGTNVDFQVLSVLSTEEAAKLLHQMHMMGYEHYDSLRGHWNDEGAFTSQLGITMFFRRRDIDTQAPQGRNAHRGARPEGVRK